MRALHVLYSYSTPTVLDSAQTRCTEVLAKCLWSTVRVLVQSQGPEVCAPEPQEDLDKSESGWHLIQHGTDLRSSCQSATHETLMQGTFVCPFVMIRSGPLAAPLAVQALLFAMVAWSRAVGAAYGYSGSVTPDNYNPISMTMCMYDARRKFEYASRSSASCCVLDKDSEGANPERSPASLFVRNPANPCSEDKFAEELRSTSGSFGTFTMFSDNKRKPRGVYP